MVSYPNAKGILDRDQRTLLRGERWKLWATFSWDFRSLFPPIIFSSRPLGLSWEPLSVFFPGSGVPMAWRSCCRLPSSCRRPQPLSFSPASIGGPYLAGPSPLSYLTSPENLGQLPLRLTVTLWQSRVGAGKIGRA